MEGSVGHGDGLDLRPARRIPETSARIPMRGARAACFGPGLDLAPHRNAVAVIALAVREPFDLAFLGERRSSPVYATHRRALIPAGFLHSLKAQGPMAFVYLDALGDDLAAVRQVDLEAASDALASEPLASWSVDRASAALGLLTQAPADPRVAAVFQAVAARPDVLVGFEDVAASVGLSPSRCRALIRRSTGVPFRR